MERQLNVIANRDPEDEDQKEFYYLHLEEQSKVLHEQHRLEFSNELGTLREIASRPPIVLATVLRKLNYPLPLSKAQQQFLRMARGFE